MSFLVINPNHHGLPQLDEQMKREFQTELSVETIFFPTKPDFPTPEIITLPSQTIFRLICKSWLREV